MGALYWAVLLVVLLGTGMVCAEDDVLLPFDIDPSDDSGVNSDAGAIEWLNEFNWIDNSGGAEAILSEDTYEALLRGLQELYGLPVTGLLDDATKELMSRPRCGVPDYGEGGFLNSDSREKRFTRTGTVWPRSTVSWFIEGTSPDLSTTQIEDRIRVAFQRWDDASGLTLLPATSAATADIRLSFQVRAHNDGNNFDGRGGTLAHAFGPGNGLGGDVHFDDDETFTIGNAGVDLHIVATHEIGHSLGLGHSTDSNAVMAPFYRFEQNFQLLTDDINGIVSLYGAPPVQAPAVPPTLPPPPPPPPATTTEAPTVPPPPTYCNGQFDAVANSFDGGLYIFQGPSVLKVNFINNRYVIADGYPRFIWVEFPMVYTANIDAAVLFRYSSGQKFLYIFNNDDYWRISLDLENGDPAVDPNYPQSITARWGGVPSNLDAAFFWTGNSYLYFIKGDGYYRYSFYRQGVDAGYPRPLSAWRGVASPVAAAFDFRGRTYFFQRNDRYQQFNDQAFRAGNQFPISTQYVGCTSLAIEQEPTTEVPVTCGSSSLVNNTPYVLLLTIGFYILNQIRN